MNIKYILIALALLSASCGKDNMEDHQSEIEKNIVTTNTLSKVDVGLKNKENSNAPYFLLGYGFDAKEETIYTINGLRSKVINMETFPKKKSFDYQRFNGKRLIYGKCIKTRGTCYT